MHIHAQWIVHRRREDRDLHDARRSHSRQDADPLSDA